MKLRERTPPLSPSLFALICLAFALPFATVSCDGAETSFSGIQLAAHSVPAGGQVAESDCTGELGECVEHKGSLLAEIALASGFVGTLLGLLGKAKGPGWCALVGLLAMLGIAAQAIALFATVEYHSGYWLSLLLFLWAGCLHGARAVRRRRARRLAPG